MKNVKYFVTVILLMIFTLSSCASFFDNLAQDPTEPPTEAPSESTDPTDSEKPPRGTLECFTVFPEGEYLEERFRTSEPLPGFDFVDTFRGDHGNGTPTSCSNETTYYYLGEGRKMLYYMDKATGTSAPLCGKPECLHTDSNCNGYLGAGNCYTLSLYDGRIWWITLELGAAVHSCALDGTDHRDEFIISRDLVGTGGVPDVYFHRGTMYWVKTDTKVVGGVINIYDEIIAFPLDGSDPYFIYRADPAVDRGYPNVFFLRDKMLLIFDRSELSYAEDGVTVTDWHSAIDIYFFDLNTRQVETVFSGDSGFISDSATVREEGIYFWNGDIIDENGGWVPVARFLPWGAESFEPMEFQRWFSFCYAGRFININLSSDKLTVTERTMDGALILDRSFPVRYTGNSILLLMQGWDEDYYYIRLPSVDVAVATDAHALYYLAGTEKES